MNIYNQHILDGISHRASLATNAYIKGQITDEEYEKSVIDYNADMQLEILTYCTCKFGSAIDFEPMFNGIGRDK